MKTDTQYVLTFLVFVFLVLVSHHPTAAQALSSPAEVGTFASSLETCTAASARTPHLLMPAFVVEHTVEGEKAGTCAYSQTMPGNMTMTCALSQAGRTALAAELKTMATGGSLKGGTSMTAPAWFKECEILLPNGNRIPAAPAK